MNTSDIELMLAEKGNPCISIVLPTQHYVKDREKTSAIIENAIQKAKNLLINSAWPKDQIKQLTVKLESLPERIDHIRLQDGLAIFISPNILKMHLLPFKVKEKVMLGKKFEIRDIVYFNQFLEPYYLLALSKKRMRLFKGRGRDLQEITNNDFPRQYVEEYEYATPSIGSSSSAGLKAFERDKSIVQETRLNAFIRQADDTLNKYLKDDTRLFIAGVEEELVNFEQVSHHLNKIAGKITGNYDHDATHPLAETAWKKTKESILLSQKDLLEKLKEDVGKKTVVDGIREVWKKAKEGKGLLLLLEKDYDVTAYADPVDDSKISLTPPVGSYEIITDAADDLIEIVAAKGGDVTILENGELENYNHIALRLRYPE